MRYVFSVLAAATLISAAGLSQPYRTAQAQLARSTVPGGRDLIVDWGVWPRLHVGMSEQQLLSVIRAQIGTVPAAEPDTAHSPIRTYTFKYQAAGSQVSESVVVQKARGVVSRFEANFKPALPCGRIVEAISRQLGDPELGPQGAINFGGSGDKSLARWRDAIRGQVIAAGLHRQDPPRTCEFISAYP